MIKKQCLCLIALCLLLCSCSSVKPGVCRSLADELLKCNTGQTPPLICRSADSEEDNGRLSEYDMAFLYTGEYGRCGEYAMIDDYCIYMSKTTVIFEIHVLRARNVTDIPALLKFIGERADRLNNTLSQNDDVLGRAQTASGAAVIVRGRYILLLATPDNSSGVS